MTAEQIKESLDQVNDQINETFWGDKERLYFLSARKRFLEFSYQLSIGIKNERVR